MPVVDPIKCLHCGLCVGSCPKNAIFLEETSLTFNDDCIECGICSQPYSNTVSSRIPKSIKCGHSFCHSCIVSLRQHNMDTPCPICQMAKAMKLESDIKKNFALMD